MNDEILKDLEGIGCGIVEILSQYLGRAIAQSVSRWFLTMAARVRACV
jgi:hypothetical protein